MTMPRINGGLSSVSVSAGTLHLNLNGEIEGGVEIYPDAVAHIVAARAQGDEVIHNIVGGMTTCDEGVARLFPAKITLATIERTAPKKDFTPYARPAVFKPDGEWTLALNVHEDVLDDALEEAQDTLGDVW